MPLSWVWRFLKKMSLAQINNPLVFVTMLAYPGYDWQKVSGVSSYSVPTHGLTENKRWILLCAGQQRSEFIWLLAP